MTTMVLNRAKSHEAWSQCSQFASCHTGQQQQLRGTIKIVGLIGVALQQWLFGVAVTRKQHC